MPPSSASAAGSMSAADFTKLSLFGAASTYALLAGAAFTGDISLTNAKYVKSVMAGGTVKNLIGITAADILQVGATGVVNQVYGTNCGTVASGYIANSGSAHYFQSVNGSVTWLYVHPSGGVRVNGTAVDPGLGGLSWGGGLVANNTAVKTSAYTILITNTVVQIDPSGGAFALTLPAPSAALAGRIFIVASTGGSFVGCTLARNGTEKINNVAATYTLVAGNMAIINCDGTDWSVGVMV